ncbi:MAG: hypothetical protein PF693_03990 [Spirochaetia bacterium]|jgi:mRNA-degrading endonuclease toxin of MazEF toxin-antitoxin module|nr:hypothetical protein [Spirochaetia bacterium]
MVVKKGQLITVQFSSGVRYGIIISTEVFNSTIHRLFFVPADQRCKRHELEVQTTINGKEYTFQPEHLISLSDRMSITPAGQAPSELTEEICRRVRLTMDLG